MIRIIKDHFRFYYADTNDINRTITFKDTGRLEFFFEAMEKAKKLANSKDTEVEIKKGRFKEKYPLQQEEMKKVEISCVEEWNYTHVIAYENHQYSIWIELKNRQYSAYVKNRKNVLFEKQCYHEKGAREILFEKLEQYRMKSMI